MALSLHGPLSVQPPKHAASMTAPHGGAWWQTEFRLAVRGIHVHAREAPDGAGVRKRRGGLQALNCFPAPGSANVRGGPARRPLETGVRSVEGSLPEEGNNAHRPVGKRE